MTKLKLADTENVLLTEKVMSRFYFQFLVCSVTGALVKTHPMLSKSAHLTLLDWEMTRSSTVVLMKIAASSLKQFSRTAL